MEKLWIAVFIPLLLATGTQQANNATEVYSWASLDYDWPNASMKADYEKSGKFVVNNNIIVGIKLYHDEVYVTAPRWYSGVPSTLNRIIMKGGKPVLQPYPSWEMHEVGQCSVLQYVQSMEIDPNTGFMWIIDNGRTNILDKTPQNLCPPKLIVYDMVGKKEVRRFVFPSDVAGPTSCFLNDIVLDYVDGCVSYVYITDTLDVKLYVYDVSKNEAYFFAHPTMWTEPPGSGFAINGIAISADFSYVYYSPVDGLGLFQIPTSVLRNKNANFGQHVRRVGDRPTRGDGLTYGQHNLYNGLLDESGVQRWLVSHDAEQTGFDKVVIKTQEAVVRDDVKMQWVDTFAWDQRGNLWFTANDLKRFFNGSMDFTGAHGPNIYVWKVFVNESSYLAKAVGSPAPSQCPVDKAVNHQEVASHICLFTLLVCLFISILEPM